MSTASKRLLRSADVCSIAGAVFLIIVAAAAVSSRPVAAQPPAPSGDEPAVLEYVGQLGGFVSAVTVHGDYAYVATGPYITALNVAADTPQAVGQSAPLMKHGPYIDLAATDSLLFATVGDRDVVVMDATDPQALPVITTITTESSVVDQVEAASSRLYVATGTEVLIFDVADPLRPQVLSRTEVYSSTAQLLLQGGHLFVVNAYPRGLLVLDVQDAHSPRVLKWLEAINVRFVAAAGGFVFASVITRASVPDPDWPRDVASLRILDASPGAGFAEIGQLDFAPQAGGGPLVATEETVYISNGVGGNDVRVVDVRQPSAPTEVGHFAIPTALSVGAANSLERAAGSRMCLVGSHLFVVFDDYQASQSGVLVVDTSNEHSPTQSGMWTQGGPGIVTKLEVAGDVLLVGEPLASQALVYDCSDHLSPRQVGRIPMNTHNVDFAISGHRAVVLDTEMFHLVDLTNPANPLTVAELSVPGGPSQAYAVAMSDQFIYLTMTGSGETGKDIAQLAVYEITDDNRVEPVYRLELGPYLYMFDVQLQGDHLYIATQEPLKGDSVWVVDVTDPSRPKLTGRIATPQNIRGQYLDGPLAYEAVELPLTEEEKGMPQPPVRPALRILDISDPMQLRQVGLVTGSEVEADRSNSTVQWGVGVSHGYALLAAGDGYVRTFDVRDPAMPRQVQKLQVPGIVSAISTLDDVSYVAGDGAGLLILQLRPGSDERSESRINLPILLRHQ